MKRISLLVALLLSGCGKSADAPGQDPAQAEDQGPYPPTAQPELHAELCADVAAVRHPSDGGGRAWMEGERSAPSASRASWTVVFEVGDLGIAEGGTIHFKVSPFWGWSDPQDRSGDVPGFTVVSCDAPGVELALEKVRANELVARVKGRALAPLERVTFSYGESSALASTDRYAERGEHFWIAVDGDADGVSAILKQSPTVDLRPGPPARLWLTVPTTARVGEEATLTLAVLDRAANNGLEVACEVSFEGNAAELGLPSKVSLEPLHKGCLKVPLRPAAAGVWRVSARAEIDGRTLEGESNPLVAGRGGPNIYWGDLHGHSNFSDGTGLPEDYFGYARDVAALDVVSLTDHDHFGMVFLDASPELWEEIRLQAARFHAPGRFVTLLGYEWTSWIYGHRHVLYFGEEGEVLSSIDEASDHPQELWEKLRGKNALTVAHHSAGGPIATDWSIPPDPELEPVTEIVSGHGSSEAADSPKVIHRPVEGNFARDALDRGYKLGFIGSGDGHDGHPGLTWIGQYPTGGLAAIIADELTREGVLAALRARRVYATSGPRIYLRCALNGHPMGSSLKAEELEGEAALFLAVVGTSPLERVDLIRTGKVVDSLRGEGSLEVTLQATLEGLASGEYVYARVVQADSLDGGDGGMAWTSPFFIE
jgi:hypothetical protein